MGPLIVTPQLVLPESELGWRFSRSSGPGGQSVNTSDSRVELLLDIQRSTTLPEHLRARLLERLAGRLTDDGVLVVVAADERSQLANRQVARRRLVLLLRTALAPPPPPRRPTRPSRSSQRRRVDAKVQRGRTKALRRRPTT